MSRKLRLRFITIKLPEKKRKKYWGVAKLRGAVYGVWGDTFAGCEDFGVGVICGLWGD